MSKRILFVDDEPMVLSGLERSFRPLRREWSGTFVNSGSEALQAIEHEHFDAIVTDMRMPGMDGAELLEEVRKRSPQTIRMILSGQSDRETLLRSINPAHQYVAKPCDTNELKNKISQAFALRDVLENGELRAMVAQLKSVPSLPTLYVKIMEELNSGDASLVNVGEIVAQDIGMTAKILQLANSAFFGFYSRISTARHAVDLLGLDTIRSIVLCVHVFSQFEADALSEADTAWLREHSLSTGSFARQVAQLEKANQNTVDDSFTAGVLHDIGKLILASAASKSYKEVLAAVADRNLSLCAAEREILGCTHAEVGAYLLGVWGLPNSIVEAVAWHDAPSRAPSVEFSPLAAVHAASNLDEEMRPYRLGDGSGFDAVFVEKLGLTQRLALWRQSCLDLAERSKKHDN